MPRLSIEIELTYIEAVEPDESVEAINAALLSLKGRIESLRSTIRVQHKSRLCRLQLNEKGVAIKIEANMVGQGLLSKAENVQLCEAAQEQFDAFCTVRLVPVSQLYGGKICAALGGQHPRDLFDVKLLLENEGFTDAIKYGFLFTLASVNRPMHELLDPELLDQRIALEHQFDGMSTLAFSYDDYQDIRLLLIDTVKAGLSEYDKAFLLSLDRLEPDWSVYDFQSFPSVRSKLLNLEKLKQESPDTYQEQSDALEKVFGV